ncbi:GNAT family N-acetyltransferase [Nocardiopsis coralliicola]
METDIELRELAPPVFVAALPALLEVYTAAMAPDPAQLPGRRSVMEQHAAFPRFRALVAAAPDGAAAGFAYGFRGAGGQWWHDVVTAEVRRRRPRAARRWFDDAFEIAEVHVHPDYQGRGTGRRMLEQLAAGRTERTAVLSTPVGPSPARGLYETAGFVDVLAEFAFPGSPDRPFAVMAAPLPLPRRGLVRQRSAGRSAGRSRGWRWTG